MNFKQPAPRPVRSITYAVADADVRLLTKVVQHLMLKAREARSKTPDAYPDEDFS